MHITSDRLTESLSDIELLHIQSCTQCKIERQKLMALKVSANQMSLMSPSDEVWQQLAKQLPVKKKKSFSIKSFTYASAASLMMLSIGWLMWSQHQLQQELEAVLVLNNKLEEQLYKADVPAYNQVLIMHDLSEINSRLVGTKSTKEKIEILDRRSKLIQQYFAQLEQEKDDLFSI
ncbi:hypothetical protein [Thalassotalea sp. G2M2-11]|uniref:hypothetical protein n=1 Tax=Thalassotalea sp. G2M2-11 TaxID=2787627 RepID=UPI0019D25773|nr:hypothetical protein [Thalassotalea sp. G2M2-11]